MKKETLKKANAFINRKKQAGITGQSQGALVSDLPKVAPKPVIAPTTPVADATMPAATKPTVPLKSVAEKKANQAQNPFAAAGLPTHPTGDKAQDKKLRDLATVLGLIQAGAKNLPANVLALKDAPEAGMTPEDLVLSKAFKAQAQNPFAAAGLPTHPTGDKAQDKKLRDLATVLGLIQAGAKNLPANVLALKDAPEAGMTPEDLVLAKAFKAQAQPKTASTKKAWTTNLGPGANAFQPRGHWGTPMSAAPSAPSAPTSGGTPWWNQAGNWLQNYWPYLATGLGGAGALYSMFGDNDEDMYHQPSWGSQLMRYGVPAALMGAGIYGMNKQTFDPMIQQGWNSLGQMLGRNHA